MPADARGQNILFPPSEELAYIEMHVYKQKKKTEQLECLCSEDSPCHPMITILLNPKSKQDKVKVTILKNSPKLPTF